MTSYVLYNTFFEVQDGGQVLCTLSKFKSFFSQFEFDNVKNTKTDLVTLILLNAKDLRKIMLYFMS